MNFNDIPQLPRAHYSIDVEWKDVKSMLDGYRKTCNLDLSPEYQRAHVWTVAQQQAYVEYCLMGGEVARILTFNSPNWQYEGIGEEPHLELVDGKQRLQAVLDFLDDKFTIFGKHKFSEIAGRMRFNTASFKFQICGLNTRQEIFQLYLNINAGGTPHTAEELDKVRAMLARENGDIQ